MKAFQKPDLSIHMFDESDPRDAPFIAQCIADGGIEKTEEEVYSILNQSSKEERIAVLQSAHDYDLDKLNKAWLAALIADGVGEATRQAAIKIQMEELAAQLDLDILNIIMEE